MVKTFPAILLALLCHSSLAQQPVSTPLPVEKSVPIEEITVTGEKTLTAMRFEILRAEDNLYAMFNELNSSDDMDIVCKQVQKSNSHIRVRVCEPVFFSDRRKENSQQALGEMRQAWSDEGIDTAILSNAMDYLEPDSELKALAAGEYEALNQEILRIALENPAYFAELQRIGELKARYERERQRRNAKE